MSINPPSLFLFNSSLPEQRQPIPGQIPSPPSGLARPVCRNTGDSYIAYAILKTIFGRPVRVPHVRSAWLDPLPTSLADAINANCSHFVFVLQDQIREDVYIRSFDQVADFLERIRIPIVPMSLCSNTLNGYDLGLASRLSPAQKRFLGVLAEKSPVIGVRGWYTVELLEKLGIKNVQVIGCPTHFESGPARRVSKRPWNPDRVITTGEFFNQHLPRAVHVLQDEAYFIDVAFLRGEENQADAEDWARPFWKERMRTTLHFHEKAIAGLLRYFPDLRKWERFYEEEDWCLTVGGRFHSAVFSLNRGVPAIVTNPDARSRESCELLGIPHRPDLKVESDLPKVYDELDLGPMNEKYDSLYAGYLEFLKARGLEPCATCSNVEEFEFPDIAAPAPDRVAQSFHLGFSEMAQFCQDSAWRSFEVDHMQQRVEDAERRWAAVQELLGEIGRFRDSAAGQLAALLQRLARRFPLAGRCASVVLRKLLAFRLRPKARGKCGEAACEKQ